MNTKFRRGIYHTDYGNAAFVSGPDARTAWDLDMGERIPIEMVDANDFVREADDCDEPPYDESDGGDADDLDAFDDEDWNL